MITGNMTAKKPFIPYKDITGDPKRLLDFMIDEFLDNDPAFIAAAKDMGRAKTRQGFIELLDAGLCWFAMDTDTEEITLAMSPVMGDPMTMQ